MTATSLRSRREFLRSTSLTVGAAAALSFPAPAVAQRRKMIYWGYEFLKESDDARANFAREWAKKNNVDLQLTMVPLKEFLLRRVGRQRSQVHAGARRAGPSHPVRLRLERVSAGAG